MSWSHSSLVSYITNNQEEQVVETPDKEVDANPRKRKIEAVTQEQSLPNKRPKAPGNEAKIDFSDISPSPCKSEFGLQFDASAKFKSLNQRFFFIRKGTTPKEKTPSAKSLDQRFSNLGKKRR